MDAKVPKPSDPQLVQRTQSSAREAWRMFEIIAEFVTATERLHGVHPAVTIFGSARVKPGERWYTLAEDISRRLSEAGFSVISGGGPGVMEAANKGAFAGPSPSVGLNIQLPHEQSANPYQDISHTFQHFFARKVMFVKLSCAFVMLPGGFRYARRALRGAHARADGQGAARAAHPGGLGLLEGPRRLDEGSPRGRWHGERG